MNMKISEIRRKTINSLRYSFLGTSRLYFMCRYPLWNAERDQLIDFFKGKDLDPRQRKELLKQIKKAWFTQHWSPKEFFIYNYENLTDEQRSEYVTEYERARFCTEVNDYKKSEIFQNKWETYQHFKKYFKRDAILVNGEKDVENPNVVKFLEKHTRIIMKPFTTACGRGIVMLNAIDSQDLRSQFLQLMKGNNTTYIMEEVILQAKEIADFHPHSVNTIRLVTVRVKDGVRIFHPLMRFGYNNSVVDNAGGGGILCAIDLSTGRLKTPGINRKCEEFEKHPNSGKTFVGFAIPKWQELLSLAKEVAQVIPEVNYVGWDFALTDNGWVMVEGNDIAQLIGYQQATHRGIKPEFLEIQSQMK